MKKLILAVLVLLLVSKISAKESDYDFPGSKLASTTGTRARYNAQLTFLADSLLKQAGAYSSCYKENPRQIPSRATMWARATAIATLVQSMVLLYSYLNEPGVKENFGWDTFRRNWTFKTLGSNNNPLYVDIIGHPIKEGWSYNLMRCQGAGPLESYLFSLIQAILWKYAYEGWYVSEIDTIDLVTALFSGIIFGEMFYSITLKLRKNGLSGGEKIIMLTINPSGLVFHF